MTAERLLCSNWRAQSLLSTGLRVRKEQMADLGAPLHLESSAVCRRDCMLRKEDLQGCVSPGRAGFPQGRQSVLK